MINEHGYVNDQVRQINGDDTVLKDLYRRARAFIHPSLLEGFGLTPLESMAHLCPVISSNGDVIARDIG